MNLATSVEAAIDPNHKLTFLLDWELTMKCNLDCSYCETGIWGGHENSQKHPSLAECLRTIDFMFEYADIQMSQRRESIRYVVLNVYGGESLHHPHIKDILLAVRDKYQQYSTRWKLTITTTTNAIVSSAKWKKIVPLIDELTISYHTENTDRQKKQFRENVLYARDIGKPVKCVVLMHSEPELFADAQEQIAWAKSNNLKVLPRQLDHQTTQPHFNYSPQQVIWFDKLYDQRSHNVETTMPSSVLEQESVDLSAEGRSCCGGRLMCLDQNYKQRISWTQNHHFRNWYCSVDRFFLYIKQVNKEVYVNKDCKMNYQGQVGPIGHLNNPEEMLKQLREGTPTIRCAKRRCNCGLCAPKAAEHEIYQSMMRKYEIPNSNLLP